MESDEKSFSLACLNLKSQSNELELKNSLAKLIIVSGVMK